MTEYRRPTEKAAVHGYWNQQSCGTDIATADKHSLEYFEQIEEYRYRIEPEIMPFAQFSRWHKKKILEVGVGAGTDFLQWVRAGADAHGVDLTEEAIENVTRRMEVYGLKCTELKIGDAENLPYESETFDLVYSWGVIHHSPDTLAALKEVLRVTKVGGHVKIMVYNRRSPYTVFKWIRWGLGKGKPFRTVASILNEHQESPGTKAYTISEIRRLVANYPARLLSIDAPATYYDLLPYQPPIVRSFAYILACLMGINRCGWFLRFEIEKTGSC